MNKRLFSLNKKLEVVNTKISQHFRICKQCAKHIKYCRRYLQLANLSSSLNRQIWGIEDR